VIGAGAVRRGDRSRRIRVVAGCLEQGPLILTDTGHFLLSAEAARPEWSYVPTPCRDDAQEALTLDPTALCIATNEAHALLFLGRFDEAKAIYLDNKDKPLGGGETFGDDVRDDFALFRKAGIDTSDMAKIEALLAS
jgi:hypothetical protein